MEIWRFANPTNAFPGHADFGLKSDHTANTLFLHSSDDDNFTRRLETVMSLIFAKLALNLLPGFRARGLGQRCEHLVQSAERVSFETSTFSR